MKVISLLLVPDCLDKRIDPRPYARLDFLIIWVRIVIDFDIA